MDLRTKKTLQSIRSAFLTLRKRKPLERITVKELSQLAEISKATFYLHYHDIYDLSTALQDEVIQSILADIDPELFLTNSAQLTKDLFLAFGRRQELIDVLFSGVQSSILPIRVEQVLKERIFQLFPQRQEDPYFNIYLTYQILGSFYAYRENNQRFGADFTIETLAGLTALVKAQLPTKTE